MTIRELKTTGVRDRSVGPLTRTTQPAKLRGRWVPRSLEMLESPAWRVLPLAARKVLERIEIEFLRRNRTNNGAIVCTYDDLVVYGVRRASIRRALAQLEALGLLKIVVRGHRAATDLNFPSLYRLTYVQGVNDIEATHDWRNFDTEAKARAALRQVEKEIDARKASRNGREPEL
ncbi:MAG: hypothetical protein ACOY5Y_07535 [Pseudomonadota bacterium]